MIITGSLKLKQLSLLCRLTQMKERSEMLNSLDKADFELLLGIANQNWIVFPLISSLMRLDVLREFDESTQDYLLEIYQLNQARNERVVSDIDLLIGLLNKLGVDFFLLKGMYLLGAGYYLPAERFIKDVDLLMAVNDIPTIYDYLEANGFRTHENDRICSDLLNQNHHELPPLLSPSSEYYIDVHKQPVGIFSQEIVSVDDFFLVSQEPDSDDRLLHLQLLVIIAHAEVSSGNFYIGFFNWRAAFDIVAICPEGFTHAQLLILKQRFSRSRDGFNVIGYLIVLYSLFGLDQSSLLDCANEKDMRWSIKRMRLIEMSLSERFIDRFRISLRLLIWHFRYSMHEKNLKDVYAIEQFSPLSLLGCRLSHLMRLLIKYLQFKNIQQKWVYFKNRYSR